MPLGRTHPETLREAVEELTRQRDFGQQDQGLAALLERALIVPVLTAHPTEVMRKSMIDHRNRIAGLMRLRDLGHTETRDGDVIEQAILRQIALLWQAIEKLSSRTRELPSEDCVPGEAHTTETFDAERLNRLVK